MSERKPPPVREAPVAGETPVASEAPIVRETVALYDAKTRLSALVDRAAEGEEIVISKSGKPKARLVPMGDVHPRREPGKGRGKWRLTDDFDAPLPAEILKAFGHPDS